MDSFDSSCPRIQDVSSVPWVDLMPNEQGDWINQRNPEFENFLQLGNKAEKLENTIFNIYSLGINSNRDAWAYNFSNHDAYSNMKRMIENYNNAISGKLNGDINSKELISWTDPLRDKFNKNIKYEVTKDIRPAMYRPFTKQFLFFSKIFNHRTGQFSKIFPTVHHNNVIISVMGAGARLNFSALVTKYIPDLHLHDTGQCFPLYWYSKTDNPMAASLAGADEYGYVRHDAITDWALETFQEHYKADSIVNGHPYSAKPWAP